MSKVVKILVILVVIVVLLVVVGGAVALSMVDSIARRAIETGSTYALGVDTTLDKADVGVFSGEFTMSGLNVSNPEGFDEPHFLNLGTGEVSVSYGSLREEVVELPKLVISNVDVQLLKKGGQSNYKVILDNLKRFESDDTTPADQPEETSSKKFVIRTIEIRNVNVHAELLPVGGSLTKSDVNLDLIELKDVGSGGEPIKMSKIMNLIVKSVLSASINKLGDIPDIAGELGNGLQSLSAIGEDGVKVLMDVGGELTDVTGDLAKNLDDIAYEAGKVVEDVGRTAEEAAKEIGKGLEDVGEGIEKVIPNPFKKKDDGGDDGGG